jgi:hypothetical protein
VWGEEKVLRGVVSRCGTVRAQGGQVARSAWWPGTWRRPHTVAMVIGPVAGPTVVGYTRRAGQANTGLCTRRELDQGGL